MIYLSTDSDIQSHCSRYVNILIEAQGITRGNLVWWAVPDREYCQSLHQFETLLAIHEDTLREKPSILIEEDAVEVRIIVAACCANYGQKRDGFDIRSSLAVQLGRRRTLGKCWTRWLL